MPNQPKSKSTIFNFISIIRSFVIWFFSSSPAFATMIWKRIFTHSFVGTMNALWTHWKWLTVRWIIIHSIGMSSLFTHEILFWCDFCLFHRFFSFINFFSSSIQDLARDKSQSEIWIIAHIVAHKNLWSWWNKNATDGRNIAWYFLQRRTAIWIRVESVEIDNRTIRGKWFHLRIFIFLGKSGRD